MIRLKLLLGPSTKIWFLLGIGLLYFWGCKKETIELSWTELHLGVSNDLTSVHFINSSVGHVVGGNSWFSGLHLYTQDGGNSWTTQPLGDKQLFNLHILQNGSAHAVGIDGYLFSSTDPITEDWTFHRMPRYDILRSVAFNNQKEGILVGGIAFDQGALMLVDSNYLVPHIDTFDRQLNGVCYSNSETIHVVGYGLILRSDDGGYNWIISETDGDNFKAIAFPSPLVGYIIGANGSILKTTDGGYTWNQQRKGDSIVVSEHAFNNLYFIDPENGYIVGENGLCWRTEDGGDNWKIVKGLPSFHFNSIFVLDGKGYIVGEDGRMIRFEE